MRPTPSPALEKFFKTHRKHCTYYIYSGDRHCSCGRDKALAEIRRLQEIEAKSPVTFPPALRPVDTNESNVAQGSFSSMHDANPDTKSCETSDAGFGRFKAETGNTSGIPTTPHTIKLVQTIALILAMCEIHEKRPDHRFGWLYDLEPEELLWMIANRK